MTPAATAVATMTAVSAMSPGYVEGHTMYRTFLFICDGMMPITAQATSKDDMRAYVRYSLGWPDNAALPRHAVVSVA